MYPVFRSLALFFSVLGIGVLMVIIVTFMRATLQDALQTEGAGIVLGIDALLFLASISAAHMARLGKQP